MIRFLPFLVLSVLPCTAQACMYDSARAEKMVEEALFVGTVKIVKVEQLAAMTFPNRPRVTYEVMEVEKRAPGFNNKTIVIEAAAPVSSCDYAGPWNEGDVVREAFYMEGNVLQPADINMKVVLGTSNKPVSEGE